MKIFKTIRARARQLILSRTGQKPTFIWICAYIDLNNITHVLGTSGLALSDASIRAIQKWNVCRITLAYTCTDTFENALTLDVTENDLKG